MMKDVHEDTGNPERPLAGRIAKNSYRAANILLPLSDVRKMSGIVGHSLKQNVIRLRDLRAQHKIQSSEQLQFEEAVIASGLTYAQLQRKFTFLKRFWWCVALVSAAFVPLLAVMVCLAAPQLHIITLLRAGTFIAMFIALAGIGALKTVISQYRRWQLSTRRLTPEEGGTFRDYRAENDWVKEALTPL